MEEQAARHAQSAQAPQADQGLRELQLRGAQAEVAETESKAALNFAKARDIERAHATQAMSSPFAGEVGVHREHGQPTPCDGSANAAKACGSDECSCSHCS
jgi:hypothetical protein